MVKAAYLLTLRSPMLGKGKRESHAGAPIPSLLSRGLPLCCGFMSLHEDRGHSGAALRLVVADAAAVVA